MLKYINYLVLLACAILVLLVFDGRNKLEHSQFKIKQDSIYHKQNTLYLKKENYRLLEKLDSLTNK